MKRIMVWLGFGSLLMFSATTIQAEMNTSTVSIQPPSEKRPSKQSPGIQSPSTSAPLVTWHTDLNSGWREAKRRDVPMMIYITTDNCVYCNAMKRDTWCQPSIQQLIAGNFVAVRLTTQDNAKTLNRIDVPAYPTTLVGTPGGKIVGHRVGYQPPRQIRSFVAEQLKQRSVIKSSVQKAGPIRQRISDSAARLRSDR